MDLDRPGEVNSLFLRQFTIRKACARALIKSLIKPNIVPNVVQKLSSAYFWSLFAKK